MNAHRAHPMGGLVLGLFQARIELRQKLTSWMSLGYLLLPIVLFGASRLFPDFFLERENAIRFVLVSTAAAWLAMTGIVTLSSTIVADQDEGVILRAKTLPFGLSGYFTGKVILLTVTSLVGLLLLLVAGELSFGVCCRGPRGGGVSSSCSPCWPSHRPLRSARSPAPSRAARWRHFRSHWSR